MRLRLGFQDATTTFEGNIRACEESSRLFLFVLLIDDDGCWSAHATSSSSFISDSILFSNDICAYGKDGVS